MNAKEVYVHWVDRVAWLVIDIRGMFNLVPSSHRSCQKTSATSATWVTPVCSCIIQSELDETSIELADYFFSRAGILSLSLLPLFPFSLFLFFSLARIPSLNFALCLSLFPSYTSISFSPSETPSQYRIYTQTEFFLKREY